MNQSKVLSVEAAKQPQTTKSQGGISAFPFFKWKHQGTAITPCTNDLVCVEHVSLSKLLNSFSGEASMILSHAIANFEWLPLFISLEIHCFYGV